ncbi:MAG: CoA pyrophosphatase [Pseudomonadales bacterium]
MSSHQPEFVQPGPQTRQAAVAIVLRQRGDTPEVLFIQRAEKDGDPWSGHMAFPGGHRDPGDAGLREAAMRETLEEIALDLSAGHYLGALDHHRAQPRGRVLDMLIAPHVFEIEGDPVFRPNYEVADVVWAPLHELARNERHDTETRPLQGEDIIFNGYRLEGGHFVWGLTYRILKSFFTTLDPDWQYPPEK